MKKRDYNVLAGETHVVEAKSGGVVTSQPSAQSGIENYVLDLDAQQVSSMHFSIFGLISFACLTTPIAVNYLDLLVTY